MKLHVDSFGMLWRDKQIIASFNPILGDQKKAMQDAQTIVHRVNCFEELRDALEFYADSSRYSGPNQPTKDGDKFTDSNAAYRQDVTRDNGAIARAALENAGP